MTHVHRAGRYLREQMSPWAIALLALITALAFTIPFLLSSPAGATHDLPAGEPTTTHGVQPEFKDGNPTECTFSDSPEGFRINAPSSGTFADPDNLDFEITLTIPSTNPPDPRHHEGPAFDFDADGGVVEDMLVKGGPDANAYDFGAGVVSDTYLHSPVNTSNDKYFGLSHIDVCYNPTVTKSGTKFHDRNADGNRDTGEEGLSGWEIRAYADDNPANGTLDAAEFSAGPAGTDTTDADGNYSIELSVGAYIVCEVAQADWIQSLPDNTVCSAGAPTLAPGGHAVNLIADESGNDFGNFQNATKSGQKFEDENGNGLKDSGETGLEGWQIHLFGTDGAGDDVHLHDTTDADGNYSFTVKPGSYTVCETIETDWFQSFPASGADCSGHGGGVGYDITLESGDTDSGNDFGNFQQATKSGVKYKDVNADGSRDADGEDDTAGNEDDEVGLSGWTIHLFGTDGAGNDVHLHDTTAADGSYSFTVDPGNYTVCETQKDDWQQTDPATGPDCSTHAGGLGYAITLGSGDTDSDNDFGNTPLSDIDVHFFDLTGFTNATISCVDGDGNVIGSITVDDENATPETVLEAQDLLIGTYTCTITIVDP